MKTYIIIATLAVCTAGFAQRNNDPAAIASAANHEKSEKGMVDAKVAEFLTTATDARLMDMKEGQLATQKGTNDAVKEYGKTILKDQEKFLDEIRKMAAARGVTLPQDISNKKKEGYEDLSELSGKKFDKKFAKMMIIDHKRDLKLFKKGVDSGDEEISEFSELYIPVIQSHLQRAKELKRSL